MTREDALKVIRNEIDLCEEESVDALALEDVYSLVEHSITLDRIKSLREDAVKYRDDEENDFVDFEVGAINGVIALIDKLIAEVEEWGK